MSSTQALIRTQATSIIGAQWLATSHSVFAPTGPALSKGFVREVIAHNPRSGTFAPGGQPRFEIQRDVDMISMVHMRFTATGIPVGLWNGGATFARWCDLLGLSSWSRCTIKSGTQLLQTVYPLEIFLALNKFFINSQRRNIARIMGSGTPAERSAWSLADKEIFCPMLTLLGLKLHGDMSQGLYVRGLNDFLTLDVSLEAAANVIETDGTLPTEPAAGWYQNGILHVEGFHINKEERQMLAQCYKTRPFSITFDDQQYSARYEIPAAQSLPSTLTFNLNNINQPVTCLMFVFRWVDDLQRVAGGAGGTRGRNLWNVAGYWNPAGGATNSIIDTVQIKSGNNDVLTATPLDRLIYYQHERDFKGDMGLAVPAVSYSHDASMVNGVLGFLSFDQIEQPRVTLALRVPTLGTAHATVGAASTADIGSSSALQVDIVGFTKMDIDQANFLLSRPFN